MPRQKQSYIGRQLSAIYERFASFAAAFYHFRPQINRSEAESVAAAFPELSPAEVAQETARGLSSITTSADYRRIGLTRRIPTSRIPFNPELDVAYRYVLVVECFPVAGRGSQYRTIIVDSGYNLTRSELEERAQAVMAQVVQDVEKYGIFNLDYDPKFCRVDYVQSAQRGV